MKTTRINGDDTISSAILKLSDGNPGAIHVCTLCIDHGDIIDPHTVLGGLGNLLSLDTHNIYGPDIWMLYKDVCGEDIVKTIACLRACQLRQITISTLKYAIANHGDGINCNQVLLDVQERIPTFAHEAKNSTIIKLGDQLEKKYEYLLNILGIEIIEGHGIDGDWDIMTDSEKEYALESAIGEAEEMIVEAEQ